MGRRYIRVLVALLIGIAIGVGLTWSFVATRDTRAEIIEG
jgi:hypothetical protein